ncbi:MAG: 23S rRNA (adenine(1618)-N(6))-methyltransferase RlmF [Chlorobi bacterium]|nr:23S rRNA (adenine(1618)-N(6))-methyltransferase RlmF [Chlorobiota bacterium]
MIHKNKKHQNKPSGPNIATGKERPGLHPRNKHAGRYNFDQLVKSCPDLDQFVKLNKYGNESIDFAKPEAVKMLNKALLKHFYGTANWDIPANYLCPPIPGRADYIHHIADLLGSCNSGNIPMGGKITCLDIGVGANCVYPIIGNKEYGWKFIGSDIDPVAVDSAKNIVRANAGDIELRLQKNPKDIFAGIIKKGELFDLTICNPPFHASREETLSGTLRKLHNLNPGKTTKAILNFGGQNNELWCEGGEKGFARNMIYQSKEFATSCFWFSTLISKQSNLKGIYKVLKKAGAIETRTIPMGAGNKISRIVAWTFLSKGQQKDWVTANWQLS